MKNSLANSGILSHNLQYFNYDLLHVTALILSMHSTCIYTYRYKFDIRKHQFVI